MGDDALATSWKLKHYDPSVLKAVALTDFYHKSPPNGHIVECGVGIGWSLGLLAHLSEQKIFGFDSFEGFPDGGKDDGDFKKSNYHAYSLLSKDLVLDGLRNIGISKRDLESRIVLCKGFFPDSFNNFNKTVSLVHLDVDLAESYRYCMEKFYPLLQRGGIMTFDEYDHELSINEWPGAKKAIDAFVDKNHLTLHRHWTGYVYLIKG